jgi:hypothetical protein
MRHPRANGRIIVSRGPPSFANSNVSDLIATGIDSRTGEIADNVSGANPVLAVLKAKGRIKTISGGNQILEELSFNANPNGGAYDGYDPLPTAPADVISGAVYDWKQYAVAVNISGKEQMQNSGKEALLDLLEERITVAEDTLGNLIDAGVFGDGTGYGGKAIGGLQYLLEAAAKASQNDVVGGIDKAAQSFWRNYYATSSTNDTTGALARAELNKAYAETSRGNVSRTSACSAPSSGTSRGACSSSRADHGGSGSDGEAPLHGPLPHGRAGRGRRGLRARDDGQQPAVLHAQHEVPALPAAREAELRVHRRRARVDEPGRLGSLHRLHGQPDVSRDAVPGPAALERLVAH